MLDTWTGPTPRGGFDAVLGNPPYVRQEHLAPINAH
jgi:methylase of polypeptide subunit release factors